MSCTARSERVVKAVSRNGLLGQVSRYLNTLGSWSTYRDLNRVEDIPGRVGQVTTAFLGLDGLSRSGWPRLAGLLGAVIAVQAVEQVTGAGVTLGARLFLRGEPIGKYRGLILRRSPLTPRLAAGLNRVSGGRLLEASGYYFFESGRTWHSQTATIQVGDTPKTLTHVRSFSLPYREYYFDRALSPQTVVEVVKGESDPETIPGFIGGVNELENITPLGGLKRAFYLANWLLIDEGERSEGGPDFVDYDALVQGAAAGNFYTQASPLASTTGSWPATGGPGVAPLTGVTRIPVRSATPSAYGTQYFRAGPATGGNPYERIKDRYRAPNGQLYPLLIRGLKLNPISMTKKVDAIYYDGELQRWREIEDEAARLALAREVEAGRLSVTPDWQDYL